MAWAGREGSETDRQWKTYVSRHGGRQDRTEGTELSFSFHVFFCLCIGMKLCVNNVSSQ